ncbi:DEAD/DEAH box helicase family protein [Hydrogenophaga sp.]|uniref:DEAD/DEAH box helicase family protein n=1 Tax=Hydrogenophaga sp. TaxID=1904254 RepID=UPI003D14B50D
MTPEARARQTIDALLNAAGWHFCDVAHANLRAGTGVAIREFPLNAGHGFADYLLYVNGKACGVIEAKKEGSTLSGVEVQSARYAQGLPASLPAWRRPLPFVFESTGVETRFTNGLDPLPRARPVFAFFRPELLVQWLSYLPAPAGFAAGVTDVTEAPTFLRRMQSRPPLVTEWGQGGASYKLWPAQIEAVTNLEISLAANKPRALIQMATGSGKTFTAISAIYRLIKFGGARRVLFLVDRGNLARQTKKEFDAYASPHNAYKFGEEFIVQHLQGGHIDGSARVVKGKNALDFHLSFYLGYLAAKHPDANLVVVANDKGYDSMLGHAKLLEFRATRLGFKARKAPVARKAVPAKKAKAEKAAPAKKVAPPAKKAVAKKVPTKKQPATQAVSKKAATKPAIQTAPAPADKALARAKSSLAKMGKNRPTKLASLLRHLKSIVGQGATVEDADALSRRLEEAGVVQVVGDLVLYP